jgi:hypothetical protein
MKAATPFRFALKKPPFVCSFVLLFVAAGLIIAARSSHAQEREEGEIVASLAGGRVIVHVAHEEIIFAAIDEPIETKSIPPRVVGLDSGHVGVLLGASEWRKTADPKPIRLDRDVARIPGTNPKYETNPEEIAPDLDTIGVAFLERLRPLVADLHHKLDFKPDEPFFEVVVIGFAPNFYGPEVWTVQYRIQQDEIATRGDFWQTRVLRPRFEQLYPPEKHAPKKLVEVRYPDTLQGPTLQQLIEGNDPDIENLSKGDPKFLKVSNFIDRGEANKAVAQDSSDFMRAILPLISDKKHFILGRMTDRGFDWVVPPDEPVEKAEKDKNRPPEAPTLHARPNPNP